MRLLATASINGFSNSKPGQSAFDFPTSFFNLFFSRQINDIYYDNHHRLVVSSLTNIFYKIVENHSKTNILIIRKKKTFYSTNRIVL